MHPMFQLDLPNDGHAVAIAQAASLAAADRLGLAAEKRARLELAVEEVVLNAVDHAYPAGEHGVIRVSAASEGAVFSLRIQDWGLPYDPAETGPFSIEDPNLAGLGLHLAWHSCDEAMFRNLGRDGKLFDLRFRLPPRPVPVEAPAAEPSAAKRQALPRLEIRPFAPSDANGVARCAWLAYGFTKPDEHLYNPAELARLNEERRLVSYVAAGPEGTIYGHGCLDPSVNALVPEFSDLVIAPVARANPTLLVQMLEFAARDARERGYLGVVANAVTAHTISQRGALRFRGVPTGAHLASVSPDWELAGAAEGTAGRQSEITIYMPGRPGPARILFSPQRHQDMLESIYTALGEPVTFAPPPPSRPLPAEPTQLSIESGLLSWGHILIELRSYGQDVLGSIAGFLRRFCMNGVASVLLQLPLADPATAMLAGRFEELGFSFSGVFPNAGREGRDILIYQYLNNVAPDTASERVAPACRPLYDYVLGERRRVDTEVYGVTSIGAARDAA
ncbi:anti-sigma regulatory factor (Ser/Thr protein kinase) [Bosea sp. BK604]|nr:anti-sigma regulatory factor (Ser/Thr protein kinase) [Bosea sp. BK604]